MQQDSNVPGKVSPLLFAIATLSVVSMFFGSTPGAGQDAAGRSTKQLKKLRKMYLCIHPLFWVEMLPGDPRRKELAWETFPGRSELSYRLELKLQEKYRQLIREAKEDEGMFMLMTSYKGSLDLREFARVHLGPRLVVGSEHDWHKYREALAQGKPTFTTIWGQERDVQEYRNRLGDGFDQRLAEDRLRAAKNRSGWSASEWHAWRVVKPLALDLKYQLEEQGYTYDLETVEFEALGENWSCCQATYPIHLGRALGSQNPIERRFDLSNPDGGPMLLEATAVEQNLPMPEGIRLFIFKTKQGRYVAQYWEGMHGIMDRPHRVQVDFPLGTVKRINLWGFSLQRAAGGGGPYGAESLSVFGRVVLSVGCGGHTPHKADLAMAENLSLEDFRAALSAGKVMEKPVSDKDDYYAHISQLAFSPGVQILIVGDFPIGHDVRLFISKTKENRFVAHYWEAHPTRRPHVVHVNFPPDAVKEVHQNSAGTGFVTAGPAGQSGLAMMRVGF